MSVDKEQKLPIEAFLIKAQLVDIMGEVQVEELFTEILYLLLEEEVQHTLQ